MCADHSNWIAGTPFGTDCEGDDGGTVTGEEVFAARCEGRIPRILLL